MMMATTKIGLATGFSARRSAATAVALLCIPFASFGVEPPLTESPLPPADDTEEIVVYGIPLKKLRFEMHKAEDNYFATFNGLNSTDEFDIRCFDHAYTGTRIPQRVCRAKFVDDIEAAAATAFLRGYPVVPTFGPMRLKAERLNAEMRALIPQHPELLAALNEFEAARQRFESEKERRCAGRILFCSRPFFPGSARE